MNRTLIALSAWPLFALSVGAAERELRVGVSATLLPPMKALIVVKAGSPSPGMPKHEAIASTTKYAEVMKLPSEGPFDLWWHPKDGRAVKAVEGIKVDGAKEIKLDDHLGIVRFRGDDQPRVSLVTVTAQDDPGPEEKGHTAIQTAADFRVDMVVPPGFYAIWITPDNGSRARKVVDRFRVQAGRVTQLD